MTTCKKLTFTFAVLFLCFAAVIRSQAQTFQPLFFFNGLNGEDPFEPLVQGTDGNLYGTTSFGGENNYGTIFKMSTSGQLTTLYSFCSKSGCTDGAYPDGLTQAVDGNLYGLTFLGGSKGQ